MVSAIKEVVEQDKPIEFKLKVLGRTLEHFGVQMYKQRPAAIAELIANSWDADAKNVNVSLPSASWDSAAAQIIIEDDGCGMDAETIQEAYLVLGRNRRAHGPNAGLTPNGRKVMGRKGIGKLAGFGIADVMKVETWKDGVGTQFVLRLTDLLLDDAEVRNVEIRGEHFTPSKTNSASGTRVILEGLRNKTVLAPHDLGRSLSRRFSRIVKGQMLISVNDKSIPDPLADYEILHEFPNNFPSDLETDTLESGNTVRYGYSYTRETIKNSELAGFTIMVHGKTAQAPPFFFRIENTASGQHATKYISGVIEADFLDDGIDTSTDIVSTDRQEVDWDNPACRELLEWGQKLARRCLAECTELRGQHKAKELSLNASIKDRIERLDSGSRKQVHKLIGAITYTDPDDARAKDLVEALLKVFEFRQFHDMVDEIEEVAQNPEKLRDRLEVIQEWKILESRAIYEVIHGRLAVIDLYEKALAANAAETAHCIGQTNLHDAIGRFPWLLDPDYNVFTEEISISKLLREWFEEDCDEEARERIDFCAIGDDREVLVVEIKRSGHAVEHEEIQRLERYMERIRKTTDRRVNGLLIYGGTLNIAKQTRREYLDREDLTLRKWSDIFETTKRRYKRFRAILQGEVDHPDSKSAEGEIRQMRNVMQTGSFYRDKEERSKGLGSQEL